MNRISKTPIPTPTKSMFSESLIYPSLLQKCICTCNEPSTPSLLNPREKSRWR
jgi:hypothetical protein